MSSVWPIPGLSARCASPAAALASCGRSRSKSLKPSTPLAIAARTAARASSSFVTTVLVRWRRRPPMPSGGGPDARPADRPVLDAVALGDDPFGRIVRNRRAGRDTEVQIDLAHPVAQMAMAVDQPGQNSLALRIDHLGAFGRLHLAAAPRVADAAVLEYHDGVGERRPAGAVDQRATVDDHTAALRPRLRDAERKHCECDERSFHASSVGTV